MKQLIIPPPELVEEWTSMFEYHPDEKVFSEVARWGADQELEACCEWLVNTHWCEPSGKCLTDLRAARRPKPPSLKELALEALELFIPFIESENKRAEGETIRRAIEALPND
jgi:hypothetical protein